MKRWSTIVRAIDPMDNLMKTWSGPDIPAPTRELAFYYLQHHGLGYCHIDAELIGTGPCNEDGLPDFDRETNYIKINSN